MAGDDQEFLAAPAYEHVRIADGGADASGDLHQQIVSLVMSEGIVDGFEMVNIDQVEDQVAIAMVGCCFRRGIGSQCQADVIIDGGSEEAAVAYPCQYVGK